jgi:tetratricopeptide (TPR) repeat protein
MKFIQLMILLVVILFFDTNFARSQNEDISKVKARIGEILKDKVEVYDKNTKVKDYPKEILTLDDRIEFKINKQNAILYFSDLTDSIKYSMVNLKAVLELKNFSLHKNITGKYTYGIFEELRKDLMLIQKQLQKKIDESQLIVFEQKALEYRKLRIKPPVSEEQRKYIVQANSMTQQKNYSEAIKLYDKAIEADQTNPIVYYNQALLLAQVKRFNVAINRMKKYLILSPEASDARSAQDKIYEWEILIQK